MKNLFYILFLMITLPSQAQLKSVIYTDGNQKLEGFLAQPKKP